MGCCNQVITNLLTGVTGGGGSDPVQSNWCVQWAVVQSSIFFPCGTDNEMNGNTNSSQLCSGDFIITNFNSQTDHTFYYNYQGWYAHVIRPSTDPPLTDLGSYSYDVFGNPSGPVTITPTDENCVLRTYQAVFTVGDVSIDAFSGIRYEPVGTSSTAIDVDLAPDNPFDLPNINALLLAQITNNLLGPEGTIDVQLNGNEVTMTIQSLVPITQGRWDHVGVLETNFNFTEI